MSLKPGDTFVGRTPLQVHGGDHLWIVLHVYKDDYDVCLVAVAVSISTLGRNADPACILRPDDHPFIHHESFAYYQKTREVPVQELAQFQRHAPCSPELLSRLRAGLHASRFTPRRLKSKVPRE